MSIASAIHEPNRAVLMAGRIVSVIPQQPAFSAIHESRREAMQRMLVSVGIAACLVVVFSEAASSAPILVGGIGFGSQTNRGRVADINAATGAGTLLSGQGVAPTAGLNGLAFDASGALYGTAISNPVFADPVVGSPTLVSLNPVTGELLSGVPITFRGDPLEVLDVTVQPGTGLLYGTSFISATAGSSIYAIDKTTGEASLIGATGVIGVTLAFAPDGVLYMTSATFGAGGVQTGSFLHTVSPATGAVLTTQAIAPAPSGNLLHFGGLAVHPSEGVLFGSAREANVNRRGDIYRLTTSGTATLVGSTGVGDVGDLDFNPIPEPSSILLLSTGFASGAVVLLRRRRQSRVSA